MVEDGPGDGTGEQQQEVEEAEAQAMEEAEALLEARQSDGGRLQDWWASDEGDSVGAQVRAWRLFPLHAEEMSPAVLTRRR